MRWRFYSEATVFPTHNLQRKLCVLENRNIPGRCTRIGHCRWSLHSGMQQHPFPKVPAVGLMMEYAWARQSALAAEVEAVPHVPTTSAIASMPLCLQPLGWWVRFQKCHIKSKKAAATLRAGLWARAPATSTLLWAPFLFHQNQNSILVAAKFGALNKTPAKQTVAP